MGNLAAPRTNRNHGSSMVLSLRVFLLALFLLPKSVTPTIYLPQYNKSFVSMPGLFGGQLDEESPITAYLTMVKEQPYMCPDELKRIQPRPPFYSSNNRNTNNTMNGINESENNDNGNSGIMDNSMMISSTSNNNNSTSETGNEYGSVEELPAPTDGLPIAFLVERGMCTFYEKALMASRYGPSVKYVIIYDDQIAPDLVPMSSQFSTDMTLLFVSAASGRELRDFIVHAQIGKQNQRPLHHGSAVVEKNETESSDGGGAAAWNNDDDEVVGYELVVTMDGISPVIDMGYPPLNMAAYFLAAMSGFLAFLIFFGCLLICAQCGWITAAPDEHGRIVLFAGGPGIRHTEGLGRMIRVDKLTRNQVLALDEEVVCLADENGGNAADENDSSAAPCCAICIDEFEDGERVRVLPCGHKFHEDCLIPWLTERHASCPLCKMDVLKHVRDLEKMKKKNGISIDTGTPDEAQTPSGSSNNGEGHRSPPRRSSSPMRSAWYRMWGWSLVADIAPAAEGSRRRGGDAEETDPREDEHTGGEIELAERSNLETVVIDP